MTFSHDHFDDPALKQALKRAAGETHAPEALRTRIAAMFQEHQAEQAAPARSWGWHLLHGVHTGRTMAMAASIGGLLLGGLAFLLTQESSPLESNPISVSPMVQNAIYHYADTQQSMDRGVSVLSPSDQFAPRQVVRPKLDPKLDLSSLGWRLLGARKHVQTQQASEEFVYQRGNQKISVFLIADDSTNPGEQRAGTALVNGHIVAIRHVPNASVCVVATNAKRHQDPREIEGIADFVIGKYTPRGQQ